MTSSRGGEGSGPDIVLVTLDCVRADHWGMRGLTPGFDAVAQEGATFSQAFSQSQNTLSSHLSMLSSNYLFQHGVYSNHATKPLPEHALPCRLAELGYRSQAFTSIDFLARALGDQLGGEDRRFATPGDESLRGRLVRRFRGRRATAAETLGRGARWLRGGPPGGRFLWLHLFDAHMVYQAPRRLLRQQVTEARAGSRCIDEVRSRGWIHSAYPELEDEVPLSYFPERYAAAVSALDEALSRFVGSLKRMGLWDSVLLAVTADHGECLEGDHGVYCEHRKLFDTTVHVPLWIRFPGGAHAGREVEALTQHVDLAPTIAAAVGFEEPLYMGHDLQAVLRGEQEGHRFAYAEHVHGLQRAARDREWLLLEAVDGATAPEPLPPEPCRLFRRDATPAPPDARAAGEELERLAKALRASRPEVRQAWGSAEEVDETMRRRLAELGYL